jgi:hypothetical protein
MKKNQAGFSVGGVLIAILVIAVIAAVGWYVAKRRDSDHDTAQPSSVADTLKLSDWGVEVRNTEGGFSYEKADPAEEMLDGERYQYLDVYSKKYTDLLSGSRCRDYTMLTGLMRVRAGTQVSGGFDAEPTTVGGYDYYTEGEDVRDCGDIASEQVKLKESLLSEFLDNLQVSEDR